MEPKQKPNGVWYFDFTDPEGKRKRISTGTRDKAKARAKMRDILLGLDAHAQRVTATPTQGGRRPEGVTLSDMFEKAMKTIWHPEKVRSQATVHSNVKILSGLFGDELIQNLTYTRLEGIVETLRERGYSEGTVKRKIDAIGRVLGLATKLTDANGRPLLAGKPEMPSVRVSNIKERVISRAEEDALFDAMELRRQNEPDRNWWRFIRFVRFLLDTGMRMGEVLNLGPANIKTITVVDERGEDREVHFAALPRYETKNGKPREVPLTNAIVDMLPELTAQAARRKGDPRLLFFPFRSGTVWYMFDNARQDASATGRVSLSDVTIHTLRHTLATRLAQGGMDLLRLRDWLGHSDIKITAQRYAHLRPEHLAVGLDILHSTPPSSTTNQSNPAKRGNASGGFTDHNRAEPGTPHLH